MQAADVVDDDAAPGSAAAERPTPAGRSTGRPGWLSFFHFRNIGAVYVWIAIIIVFSFWAPDTFPRWATVQSVLNQNAITGIIALALVVPLSAGVFDLSVGNAMGLCNVIVAWLLVDHNMSMGPAIVITVVSGVVIGLVNAGVVVLARIDSFIATLATGSLMAAITTFFSNNQAIIGDQLNGTFGKIATKGFHGVAIPVLLMLVVAAGIWYLLKYTVTGRRIYATGFNEIGARLTGISTRKLTFGALVVSGAVAGIAGVLLASQVSSGSPDIGPPYLLDAFAAAFLGATQFGGRFNAWGTVIAVLLLGTGKLGLTLVNAPVWAPSMFSGVVLLFALGLGNFERFLDARRRVKARLAAGSTPTVQPGTVPGGAGAAS